jgi:hypothetical protein
MNGKIVFRIIAGLVLIAAIGAIAFFAFNMGLAQHVQIPAANGGQTQLPNGGMPYNTPYFWHPFPFLGFGCFAPLIAIFLLFLAFRAFSFLFWGPHWGYSGHMHRAWRRGGWNEGEVPPMFQEWHKRAHGESVADEKKE